MPGACGADDVVVVVALPDRGAGRVAHLVDAAGDGGLIPGDARSKGAALRAAG